jgi:hypothetical protein
MLNRIEGRRGDGGVQRQERRRWQNWGCAGGGADVRVRGLGGGLVASGCRVGQEEGEGQ